MSDAEKFMNKVSAWRAKRNPWITVENPNPNETNKRFIKVRSNEYWGNPEPKREKTKNESA